MFNEVKLNKMGIFDKLFGKKIKEMYCDFCGNPISPSMMVLVSARKLQKAVEDGFNPYKTPDIDMGITKHFVDISGVGKDVAFAEFKRRVINDNTDWALCPDCGLGFNMWYLEALGGEHNHKKSFKREDLDSASSGLKCAFCGKIITGEAKVRHHHWWCGECEGEFKLKKVKRSS